MNADLDEAPAIEGRWVTRLSSRGCPYTVWSPPMPLIPSELLHCVFYLYPSQKAAEDGVQAGGTGFFIGIPIDPEDHEKRAWYIYAVTNKHVVNNGGIFLRINTFDDKFDVLSSEHHEWEPHPNHDISVLDIGLTRQHKYGIIDERVFLTEQIAADHFIGPGDGVFMIGRFKDHEGRQRNTPSARFGFISMMPGEPIRHPENLSGFQDSFAVEMRSISGYSGSPVFFYNDTDGRPSRLPLGPKPRWLIGVDWGHIRHREPVRNPGGKPHPDKLYVDSNSAMSGVVPVWHLSELLHSEKLKRVRDMAEKKRLEKAAIEPLPPALDYASEPEPPTMEGDEQHKERFTATLASAVNGPPAAAEAHWQVPEIAGAARAALPPNRSG